MATMEVANFTGFKEIWKEQSPSLTQWKGFVVFTEGVKEPSNGHYMSSETSQIFFTKFLHVNGHKGWISEKMALMCVKIE